MEHYRCHKAYIPKIGSERISDTVEFSSPKTNMPRMSSTEATIHAAQYLIRALQNPAPAIPLATLGNAHKEALRSLAEIFGKATSPAIPLRMPVRGA